jgi:LPXTG-motif cell wall-anchored protein
VFGFDVRVASTVNGPVNLTGGSLIVEALGEAAEVPAARAATAKKWGNAAMSLDPEQYKDIDATDNSDDFIAYVAGAPLPPGELPTTGANTLLITAVGAGMLAAGAALFMITRRRRLPA